MQAMTEDYKQLYDSQMWCTPKLLDGLNCESKSKQWKEKELGRVIWLAALQV